MASSETGGRPSFVRVKGIGFVIGPACWRAGGSAGGKQHGRRPPSFTRVDVSGFNEVLHAGAQADQLVASSATGGRPSAELRAALAAARGIGGVSTRPRVFS